METKVSSRKIEVIRRNCGFVNEIDAGAEGSKGKLSLGWRSGWLVHLRNYYQFHIDVNIQREQEDYFWRFTGFYGHLEKLLRFNFNNLLRHLR